ncbi:MAG: hypothetical protein M3422_19100 [Actinomycetota bacterium]|nr:hypothetical protein [Actinomycetota bacterium]
MENAAERSRVAAEVLVGVVAVAGFAVLYGRMTPAGRVFVALFLAIAVAAVLTRRVNRAVWFLGLLALGAAPVLLVVAADLVEGAARADLLALLGLYCAGALGGLVLELLTDDLYRLELPSRANPGDGKPLQCNLGFLSRMTVGGLSGITLVTLFGQVGNVGDTPPTGTAALVWALAAGATSPAVWTRVAAVVQPKKPDGGTEARKGAQRDGVG